MPIELDHSLPSQVGGVDRCVALDRERNLRGAAGRPLAAQNDLDPVRERDGLEQSVELVIAVDSLGKHAEIEIALGVPAGAGSPPSAPSLRAAH